MSDSDISVDRGLEIIESGDRDILVHDGKYGPSVIRGNDDPFALAWYVTKGHGDKDDVELSGPSFLSREDVRDLLEDAVQSDIDVEVVNPDSGRNPWVYNLLE